MSGRGLAVLRALFLLEAVLLALGGLMGYLKAGSTKSLISGGALSALLAYAGWGLASPAGLGAATAAAGAAAAVLGARWLLKGSFMPAGFLALQNALLFVGAAHGLGRA